MGADFQSPLNFFWKLVHESFLVVQWLRLHAANAGITGLISGGGIKIPHVAQCGLNKTKQKTQPVHMVIVEKPKWGHISERDVRSQKSGHRCGQSTGSQSCRQTAEGGGEWMKVLTGYGNPESPWVIHLEKWMNAGEVLWVFWLGVRTAILQGRRCKPGTIWETHCEFFLLQGQCLALSRMTRNRNQNEQDRNTDSKEA